MHNECHKEYHAFKIVLTLITKVTLVLQPSKSGVSGSSNRGSCWAEVSEKMMLNGAPREPSAEKYTGGFSLMQCCFLGHLYASDGTTTNPAGRACTFINFVSSALASGNNETHSFIVKVAVPRHHDDDLRICGMEGWRYTGWGGGKTEGV